MILNIALYVVNTMAAWGFALFFIRRKWAEIWFNGLLCAAVHGLSVYVADGADENILSGISLIWFLLMTVIIQLQKKDGYGNAAIAFGLAQSVYSIFYYISHNGTEIWGKWGICLYFASGMIFLLLTCAVKDKIPDENWREYYTEGTPVPEKINVKTWHVYLIIALGCGILSAFMWQPGPVDKLAFLVTGAGIFALFWSGIWLLVMMQAYRRERVEVLLDRQYRDEMQSFMNVIRSQRHDYNFHVHTIAGLLRSGNLEECLKYMDALEKDSAVMNSILPVKEPAISATIHNFHFLAVREGIPFSIDIENDLSQIATNVYETNKIISNLLQNAIDETKTHADKSYGIHLTILKRGEYIVIRVSNEIDPLRMEPAEMDRIYRQGYSTKQGHDGVGLGSIRQLAGRYHGTVYTRLEGQVIHFVAKIPINFAKEQEEQ